MCVEPFWITLLDTNCRGSGVWRESCAYASRGTGMWLWSFVCFVLFLLLKQTGPLFIFIFIFVCVLFLISCLRIGMEHCWLLKGWKRLLLLTSAGLQPSVWCNNFCKMYSVICWVLFFFFRQFVWSVQIDLTACQLMEPSAAPYVLLAFQPGRWVFCRSTVNCYATSSCMYE